MGAPSPIEGSALKEAHIEIRQEERLASGKAFLSSGLRPRFHAPASVVRQVAVGCRGCRSAAA